jgi:hypothetical protein
VSVAVLVQYFTLWDPNFNININDVGVGNILSHKAADNMSFFLDHVYDVSISFVTCESDT